MVERLVDGHQSISRPEGACAGSRSTKANRSVELSSCAEGVDAGVDQLVVAAPDRALVDLVLAPAVRLARLAW